MSIQSNQLRITSKNPCRLATTGDIADLAAGAPDTVDGVTVVAGDRILVKEQATAAQNGVYVVDTVGTGADGAWSRDLDFEDSEQDKITAGVSVFIQEGDLHAERLFVLTTVGAITVGVTDLAFQPLNEKESVLVFRSGGAGATTLTPSDSTVIAFIDTSATETITLPPASDVLGQTYYISHFGDGSTTVTVVGSGSETINGGPSVEVPTGRIIGFQAVGLPLSAWLGLNFSELDGDGIVPGTEGLVVVVDDTNGISLGTRGNVLINNSSELSGLAALRLSNGVAPTQSVGTKAMWLNSSVLPARFETIDENGTLTPLERDRDAEIFVDSNGDDSYNGQSPEAAVLTIATAVLLASGLTPSPSNPVTIYLMSRTFSEGVILPDNVNLIGPSSEIESLVMGANCLVHIRRIAYQTDNAPAVTTSATAGDRWLYADEIRHSGTGGDAGVALAVTTGTSVYVRSHNVTSNELRAIDVGGSGTLSGFISEVQGATGGINYDSSGRSTLFLGEINANGGSSVCINHSGTGFLYLHTGRVSGNTSYEVSNASGSLFLFAGSVNGTVGSITGTAQVTTAGELDSTGLGSVDNAVVRTDGTSGNAIQTNTSNDIMINDAGTLYPEVTTQNLGIPNTNEWGALYLTLSGSVVFDDQVTFQSVSSGMTLTGVSTAGFTMDGFLVMTEVSAINADNPGDGQLYVKDDTPNTLVFRDDSGADHYVSQFSYDFGSVNLATTANIADLATGAPDTVDGFGVGVGNRILVKDQSTASENGIYVVDVVGTGADGEWSRATDFDSDLDGRVIVGAQVFIRGGTANGGEVAILTSPTGGLTVGTSNQTWQRLSPTSF